MARKNPFPGVSRLIDRHGKVRWSFRKKGFSCYLPGVYGSVEFRAAYEAALDGGKAGAKSETERGTVSWLIERYLSSPKYLDRAEGSKRTLRRELDWLRDQAGDLPFARIEPHHVEALMGRKTGPAAANKVKKTCRCCTTMPRANTLIRVSTRQGSPTLGKKTLRVSIHGQKLKLISFLRSTGREQWQGEP